MKILAFVDMHESQKALEKIKNKAKNADVLVCAGDVSIFENKLQKILSELNKLKKPVFIIPGNHESGADLRELAEKFRDILCIEMASFVNDGYIFLGYGGGGFSSIDKDFDKLAKKFEKEIKRYPDKKIILVTHAPPYKTKLDDIMGEACGNKNIKNFILKVKPDLVISGHLHENAGKEDQLGKTKIINPGPYGRIVNV